MQIKISFALSTKCWLRWAKYATSSEASASAKVLYWHSLGANLCFSNESFDGAGSRPVALRPPHNHAHSHRSTRRSQLSAGGGSWVSGRRHSAARPGRTICWSRPHHMAHDAARICSSKWPGPAHPQVSWALLYVTDWSGWGACTSRLLTLLRVFPFSLPSLSPAPSWGCIFGYFYFFGHSSKNARWNLCACYCLEFGTVAPEDDTQECGTCPLENDLEGTGAGSTARVLWSWALPWFLLALLALRFCWVLILCEQSLNISETRHHPIFSTSLSLLLKSK